MHFYFRPSRKSEGWLDDGQIIAMPQSQSDNPFVYCLLQKKSTTQFSSFLLCLSKITVMLMSRNKWGFPLNPQCDN